MKGHNPFPPSLADQLVQWREHLHRHPELSNKEIETTAFVEAALRDMGVTEISRPAPTGLVAQIHGTGDGDCLAFRADMDALPVQEESGVAYRSRNDGVMHACGHDMHTTCLLGLASVLQANRQAFCGTVKLLFQPAEEVGMGAIAMIAGGALENPRPKMIAALHVHHDFPLGTIGLRSGPMMAASDSFEIELQGSQGHGAYPHKTIDPMIALGHVITAVQSIVSREVSPLESAVISICAVHGGTASNIIPQRISLTGTIRSHKPEVRNCLHHALRRVVQHSAAAHNVTAEVTIKKGTPPLICDVGAVQWASAAAAKAIGAEKVLYASEPYMGGEDFACYVETVPGMMFRLGTDEGNEGTSYPLHSPRFYASHDALLTGVKVFYQMVLDKLGL